MRKAIEVLKLGTINNDKILTSVTLSYEDRFRRRIKMLDDSGNFFLLDLQEATQLNDGDKLKLKEGGIIEVKASIEEVMDISCEDSLDNLRIAWHIGNRHIPLQVLKNGKLRLLKNQVLINMIEGLGAKIKFRFSKFHPERGAYKSIHE